VFQKNFVDAKRLARVVRCELFQKLQIDFKLLPTRRLGWRKQAQFWSLILKNDDYINGTTQPVPPSKRE
jgi:hypothetical protein